MKNSSIPELLKLQILQSGEKTKSIEIVIKKTSILSK